MGLSVTVTYGILFTASLFMLSVLLNGLLYSYDQFKSGIDNRINILENKENTIKIDRIVLNATKIEIYAINEGPNTLNTSQLSIVLNGTPANFTAYHSIWYPGESNVLTINSTWDLGTAHMKQFSLFNGKAPIATAEYDKIYILNQTGVYAYYYSGALAWSSAVVGPRDISATSSSIYVLNTTGILVMNHDGGITSFFGNMSFNAIAARGSTIYAVNSSTLAIINATTGDETNIALEDGKDVAVGKYVFVIDGSVIKYYTYTGEYLGEISGGALVNPQKISSSPDSKYNYLVVLNGDGNVLIYKNEALYGIITPQEPVGNISLYGKIYLSGESVLAYDGGFRIKIVDSFGNQMYGEL